MYCHPSAPFPGSSYGCSEGDCHCEDEDSPSISTCICDGEGGEDRDGCRPKTTQAPGCSPACQNGQTCLFPERVCSHPGIDICNVAATIVNASGWLNSGNIATEKYQSVEDKRCSVAFKLQPGFRVQVTIYDLDTYQKNDRLEFFEGDASTAPLVVGNISEAKPNTVSAFGRPGSPITWTSPTSEAMLLWKTDSGGGGRGWSAEWKSIPTNCSNTPDCESLNRAKCLDTTHTCGKCLEGFAGIDEDQNTLCTSFSSTFDNKATCATQPGSKHAENVLRSITKSLQWKTKISEAQVTGVAVDALGELAYVTSFNSKLICLRIDDGKKMWEHASSSFLTEPVVGQDGNIYFKTVDGRFESLDPAGKLRWSFKTLGQTMSRPIFSPNQETVYFTLFDFDKYCNDLVFVHALDTKTGFKVWEEPTIATSFRNSKSTQSCSPFRPALRSFTGSGVVGGDGSIFITTNAGHVVSLSSTGRINWNYTFFDVTDESVNGIGTPIVTSQNLLVFKSDNTLVALNASTGTDVWRVKGQIDDSKRWVSCYGCNTMAEDANGIIYGILSAPAARFDEFDAYSFGSRSYLVAITQASGQVLWKAPVGVEGADHPVVLRSGDIVVAYNGNLRSFDTHGRPLWQTSVLLAPPGARVVNDFGNKGTTISTVPVESLAGTILVGTYGGELLAYGFADVPSTSIASIEGAPSSNRVVDCQYQPNHGRRWSRLISEIGEGNPLGGLVVANQRGYYFNSKKDDIVLLSCFDTASGAELWATSTNIIYAGWSTMPIEPVIGMNGEIFAYLDDLEHGLAIVAFDQLDGKIRWKAKTLGEPCHRYCNPPSQIVLGRQADGSDVLIVAGWQQRNVSAGANSTQEGRAIVEAWGGNYAGRLWIWGDNWLAEDEWSENVHDNTPSNIMFSTRAQTVYFTICNGGKYDSDTKTHVYAVESGKLKWNVEINNAVSQAIQGSRLTINSMALSDSGSVLLAGGVDFSWRAVGNWILKDRTEFNSYKSTNSLPEVGFLVQLNGKTGAVDWHKQTDGVIEGKIAWDSSRGHFLAAQKYGWYHSASLAAFDSQGDTVWNTPLRYPDEPEWAPKIGRNQIRFGLGAPVVSPDGFVFMDSNSQRDDGGLHILDALTGAIVKQHVLTTGADRSMTMDNNGQLMFISIFNVLQAWQLCSPGDYERLGVCEQCPPGHECPTPGMATPIPCTPGHFQKRRGETQCRKCPAGSFSTGSKTIECTETPVGHYTAAEGSVGMEPCPYGRRSNVTGSALCEACPWGSYTNATGTASCQTCSSLEFCPVGATKTWQIFEPPQASSYNSIQRENDLYAHSEFESDTFRPMLKRQSTTADLSPFIPFVVVCSLLITATCLFFAHLATKGEHDSRGIDGPFEAEDSLKMKAVLWFATMAPQPQKHTVRPGENRVMKLKEQAFRVICLVMLVMYSIGVVMHSILKYTSTNNELITRSLANPTVLELDDLENVKFGLAASLSIASVTPWTASTCSPDLIRIQNTVTKAGGGNISAVVDVDGRCQIEIDSAETEFLPQALATGCGNLKISLINFPDEGFSFSEWGMKSTTTAYTQGTGEQVLKGLAYSDKQLTAHEHITLNVQGVAVLHFNGDSDSYTGVLVTPPVSVGRAHACADASEVGASDDIGLTFSFIVANSYIYNQIDRAISFQAMFSFALTLLALGISSVVGLRWLLDLMDVFESAAPDDTKEGELNINSVAANYAETEFATATAGITAVHVNLDEFYSRSQGVADIQQQQQQQQQQLQRQPTAREHQQHHSQRIEMDQTFQGFAGAAGSSAAPGKPKTNGWF